MIQTLITGGCSFSEGSDPFFKDGKPFNNPALYGKSWAWFLRDFLNPTDYFDLAMGGQGNDMISKKVIFTLDKVLKTQDSQSILVGIMWSGIDRISLYNFPWHEIKKPYDVATPGWYNHTYNPDIVKLYSSEAKYIMTLENILRTQWFLQKHNIKYFMTMHTDAVLPSKHQSQHPEIRYLLDMIDFSTWACTIGQFEWCKEYSGYPFPNPRDFHPGTDQHREFFNQKILPFLKEKNYVNSSG